MLSLSLPSSLSTADFSSKTLISPPQTPSPRVRSRPVVAFATATATATATEDRSTWTGEQPRSPSYLNHHGSSLYGVLGIPAGASNQEIKAAYRRLARVFHPDVAAIDRKNSSADEFMRIHAAYSTLSDPEKRANYDRSLLRRSQRPLTMASIFPGYASRNWETDQCW